MDKILTSYTCTCGCNDTFPPDALRITAGNDFSIVVQLTVKEGDEWVRYDMTDARDIELNVVSPNGKRIETPCVVDDDGNLNGVIDAQSFKSQTLYGVEVVWTDTDDLDRRAFAPDVFVFVNDSRDATDDGYEYTSDNPYEYNLKFNGDLAVLSIGRIPDVDMTDYYTKTECDERFIDTDEFVETLNSYVRTDELDNFVTFTELDTMSYVTAQQLDGCGYLTNSDLNGYATFSDIDGMGYITNNDLTDYTTFADIDGMGYLTNGDLSDYPTFADIDGMGYITSGDLTDYTTFADIDGMGYITSGNLTDYATFNDIDGMGYITNNDLTDYTTFADIDGMGYITNNDLTDYVTFNDINAMSYVTSSDLTDYTTFADIDAMSYTTYDYLDYVVQNLPIQNNVVTCDDATYIYMLTQQDYDTLEQNQQLDSDTFYYITDASPVYVSYAALNDMSYITMSDLNSMSYIATGDNISSLTNDSGFLMSGDNVSSLNNDSGFLASGDNVSSLTNDAYYVTSSDASIVDIISISQNDYDTLVNNQQTDANTLYIII